MSDETPRVWVVSDTGKYAGVVGVFASESDAFEEVDIRSGRGDRPDIAHRLRVESWRVRAALATESATGEGTPGSGLDAFGNPAAVTGDTHDPYACCHDHYPAAPRTETPDLRALDREALWETWAAGERLAYGCGYRDGRRATPETSPDRQP